MVNIFDTIRARVEASGDLLPMERRAMFWFRSHTRTLEDWQRENKNQTYDRLRQQQFTKRVVPPKSAIIGSMYFFVYQPLGAAVLPYYDRFPFSLVIDRDNDGFLALNFHYLPYRIRAILFDALYSTRLQKRTDPLKTRLMVSYKILKAVSKYKAFRPCLKRYRFDRCRSALLQVGESEWDLALFLPVEQFSKAMRTDVWNESLAELTETGEEIGEELE